MIYKLSVSVVEDKCIRNRLKKRSADFERLVNQVDHLLMLSRFLGDPSLNAVHGFSDRDREAVENCDRRVFHQLTGLTVTLKRDGAITRASSGGGTRHIGWSNDGLMEQLVESGFPITFIFDSEVKARRANEALVTAGKNEDFSPPLRLALKALKPKTHGNEVDADIALLMRDTAAMEAAVSVMKRSDP